MNVSVSPDDISFADRLVNKYNFVSRSELIRHIFRVLRHKPQVLADVPPVPFISAPKGQSIREIIADFRKTGKYSQAFLKSLEAGLKTSDYFKP